MGILLTFMIDGMKICFNSNKKIFKIPNIYFIPTILHLKWLEQAGLRKYRSSSYNSYYNRWTKEKQNGLFWSKFGRFLDPNDSSKTVEGYPAPKSLY